MSETDKQFYKENMEELDLEIDFYLKKTKVEFLHKIFKDVKKIKVDSPLFLSYVELLFNKNDLIKDN